MIFYDKIQKSFKLADFFYSIEKIKLKLAENKKNKKILLATDCISKTSEDQFLPFYRYRKYLRKEKSIIFNRMLINKVIRLTKKELNHYDFIFLKLDYKTERTKFLEICLHIHKTKNEDTKLFYFDGDDDLTILFPEVLKYFEKYIKKHIFENKNDYLRSWKGKNNLIEYCVNNHGLSLEIVDCKTCPKVKDKEELVKINDSWNLGYDDKIQTLMQGYPKINLDLKSIDVTCRALNDNKNDWRIYLRQEAGEKIKTLSTRYNINSSSKRVSQKDYYDELLKSKICVSPFGYGELCWRDFEAVICRALLIKPDVRHIKTWPNIFIPYKTYIPVEHDYKDLVEKCEYYLNNKEERLKIVNDAYDHFTSLVNENEFSKRLNNIIS